MNTLTKVFALLLLVVLLTGCFTPERYDEPTLDSYIELTKALSTANTASSPINPYALPIGIGLTGITAMLEALRRKEKSARKYAEHELNATGKT